MAVLEADDVVQNAAAVLQLNVRARSHLCGGSCDCWALGVDSICKSVHKPCPILRKAGHKLELISIPKLLSVIYAVELPTPCGTLCCSSSDRCCETSWIPGPAWPTLRFIGCTPLANLRKINQAAR